VSPPPTTEETVRKAVVETKGLTDPTAPNPTIDSGNAPAGGLLATPLILLCLKYCLHFQKSMRLYNWL